MVYHGIVVVRKFIIQNSRITKSKVLHLESHRDITSKLLSFQIVLAVTKFCFKSMLKFGSLSILLSLLHRFLQERNRIHTACRSISSLKNLFPQMSIIGFNTASHCHFPNSGLPTPWFSVICHVLAAEWCF